MCDIVVIVVVAVGCGEGQRRIMRRGTCRGKKKTKRIMRTWGKRDHTLAVVYDSGQQQ